MKELVGGRLTDSERISEERDDCIAKQKFILLV